jgi:hypothetical protein
LVIELESETRIVFLVYTRECVSLRNSIAFSFDIHSSASEIELDRVSQSLIAQPISLRNTNLWSSSTRSATSEM